MTNRRDFSKLALGRTVSGGFAQTAYGFAYMRALLNRANAEAKG